MLTRFDRGQALPKVIIIGLALAIIVLGYLRNNYLINFFIENQPILIPRRTFSEKSLNLFTFPGSIDPRWFSAGFYSCTLLLTTSLIIQILFNQKLYLIVTMVIYAVLIFITAILYFTKYTFGSTMAGIISSKLSNLLQDIILPIFLLAVYYLYDKSKDNYS